MQNRITREIDLLKDDGTITEEGYATDLLWRYDRDKIKSNRLRIKEWDYYYILNHKFGITLTIADLGYAAFAAVAWLDFEKNTVDQFDSIKLLGKIKFPNTSKAGSIIYKDKKIELKFEMSEGKKLIEVNCPSFMGGLYGKLEIEDKHEESMVIATSWKENRKKFYYNQKINCMPVEGEIIIGVDSYKFNRGDSFAGLDWGRGNWTYKNRWYWASASDVYDGKRVGWNLGYGFTDRTPASEDMLFYDGNAHKLNRVHWNFNPDNYMDPWRFSSDDGRFEMTFTPAIDRASKTNLLIIKSIQHQVFGYYSGLFVLDDGTKIEVENILGFAEDVLNHW